MIPVRKNLVRSVRPFPCTHLSTRGKWIVWQARFARAFHKFFRFSTGLFVSFLLAVSLAAA